ncbi:MAG TPA: hypothetical protein VEF89_06420 [Solirubrobacteraceae bacterium]|nr:hypothetical protein [Solirubrobacteraceae bacterium]
MFTTRTPPEAASETFAERPLQAAIAARLDRGDTLDTVERELIAPSGLPEEQQSALWLYAWSCQSAGQPLPRDLRSGRRSETRSSP